MGMDWMSEACNALVYVDGERVRECQCHGLEAGYARGDADGYARGKAASLAPHLKAVRTQALEAALIACFSDDGCGDVRIPNRIRALIEAARKVTP